MIDLNDKPGLNQDKFISLLNGCVVGSGKLQFMRDAWKFMWKLIGACNFDLATLNSFLQSMKVWASFWFSQEMHLNRACFMQNIMGSRPSPSYTFYQYVLLTMYFITSLSYSVYLFSIWINSLWQWAELRKWLFCFWNEICCICNFLYIKIIVELTNIF